MKRTMFAALAAALTFAAFAAPACADQDEDGAPAPMEQSEGHEQMMSAAKLKDKLGLTDDQVSKLDEAMKTHQDAVKPLRERMKADFQKLREQVKSKAADAEVKATLDDLDGARKGLREAMDKLRSDSVAILTPTQQAKMALWHARRMKEHWRGRGHGSKGAAAQGDEEGGDQ